MRRLGSFVFERKTTSATSSDVSEGRSWRFPSSGFVAEHYTNGEDAGGVRILFGEGLFILVNVGPGFGGDGHAFVRVERGGSHGCGLLLLSR